MASPTSRSLKFLRDSGWIACVVERFLPAYGSMKFPRRIDAFNFGDILACSVEPTSGEGMIALVQAFPLARWRDHLAKIAAIKEAQTWKAAGGIILIHGWALKPKNG